MTPGVYPAQKSNLWIALGSPGPHSATAVHKRPTPRFTGWMGTGATPPPGRAAKALGGADTGETAGGPLRWHGTALCAALSAGHIAGAAGGAGSCPGP